MNAFDIAEKYNISINDVRTHFEKRVKLANMNAQLMERSAKAESCGNKKEKKLTERHQKRLDKIGPSLGNRFKVHVRGTFDYDSIVYAPTPKEAIDVATTQMNRLSNTLKLHVSKVSEPIPA